MTYREKSQNNNPDLVKSMICLGKSHIFLTRIQKKRNSIALNIIGIVKTSVWISLEKNNGKFIGFLNETRR